MMSEHRVVRAGDRFRQDRLGQLQRHENAADGCVPVADQQAAVVLGLRERSRRQLL